MRPTIKLRLLSQQDNNKHQQIDKKKVKKKREPLRNETN